MGYLFGTYDDVPLLSAHAVKILLLLRERGEMTAREIAAACEIKYGSIYVTLSRMHWRAYVESRQQRRMRGRGGTPNRLYTATHHGLCVLEVYEDMVATALPAFGA